MISQRRKTKVLGTTGGSQGGFVSNAPITQPLNLQSPAIMTYFYNADPSSWADFTTFLGRAPQYALDFVSKGTGNTWANWLGSLNSISFAYTGLPQRLVISLPPVTNGVTLASVAAGTYDTYFQQAADQLVSAGQANSIIRLAWEMNGGWFDWAVTGSAGFTMTDFINCWQHIHDTMMARSGAQFEWFWCPNSGYGQNPTDQYYPGDAYVDYIGLDTYWMDFNSHDITPAKMFTDRVLGYDTTFFTDGQQFALVWATNFAAAHGKRLAIGEAGSGIRPDSHGGGDSSYFWINLVNWLVANNAAFLGIWTLPASDYWAEFKYASNYTLTPPADWRDDQIRTAWAIRHLFGTQAMGDLSTTGFEVNAPASLSLAIVPAYDAGGGAMHVPLGTAVSTVVGQLSAAVGERIHWTKEDSANGGNDGGLLFVDQHTGSVFVNQTPATISATAMFSARNDVGGATFSFSVSVS